MTDRCDIDITAENIYTEKASMKTAHSNAYVSGIGRTRKIVVQDTLINQMEIKEVVAIVVHELGHIYHTHLLKIACTVIIYVIFLLAIFS